MEVSMDNESIERHRRRIEAQLGVDSEYIGSGPFEFHMQEHLSPEDSGTLHSFRLLEHPQDYPGYDTCYIVEDWRGHPVYLWLSHGT
jgi:hypothetical protein